MSNDKQERELDEFGFDSEDIAKLEEGIAGEIDGDKSKLNIDVELDDLSEDESKAIADELLEKRAAEKRKAALKKEKKKSTGLVLGLSAVAITAAVGVGGYLLLPTVLGHTAEGFDAPVATSQSVKNPAFSDLGAPDDSLSFGADLDGGDLKSGADNNFSFSDTPDSIDFDVVSEVEANSGNYLSGNKEGDTVYQDDIIDEGGAIIASHGITEEDRVYDDFLMEADAIEAPHNAIKIDSAVVGMTKRLNRVEVESAQSKESLSDMAELLRDIHTQTSEISKAIAVNNQSNINLAKELESMRNHFSVQVSQLKSEIASGSIVSVDPKPVVVAKPVAKAVKAITLPAPKSQPVAVRAPEKSVSCAATKVSENWVVKGVTPTSAYVRRQQDGFELFVRKGVALPGFGSVLSFNPVERSVCTTSGIVRR